MDSTLHYSIISARIKFGCKQVLIVVDLDLFVSYLGSNLGTAINSVHQLRACADAARRRWIWRMGDVHISDVHILQDPQKPYLTVPYPHPCVNAVLGARG
jgi:hypothetical protein